MEKKRCSWCNLDNPLYVKYHDEEWGVPNFTDKYLFEMLILESFQAGLSWECILNKREAFRKAYDDFDVKRVSNYGEKDIKRLLNDKGIIRNRRKILASIDNARVFDKICQDYGSFNDYLKTFTKGKTFYEVGNITSTLGDELSRDLYKRGMKFVGPTITYSYLQAIGVVYSHDSECFLSKK